MWFNKEKCQFPCFPSSRFCPIPKFENLKISKSFLLLQLLVVYENQNLKTEKNDLWQKILTLQCGLISKNAHFRDLRVFTFALYLKSKTWKTRKVLVYFKFLSFQLYQAWERLKPFTEFEISRFHVLMSHVKEIKTSYKEY